MQTCPWLATKNRNKVTRKEKGGYEQCAVCVCAVCVVVHGCACHDVSVLSDSQTDRKLMGIIATSLQSYYFPNTSAF